MALAELTPDVTTYLGRAARLQLSLFETAAHAVATAPDIQAKDDLSPVAQLSLDKYRALVAELEHTGHDPAAAMEPFSAEIDTFRQLTAGSDWYELLVTAYVTAALLDDFFLRLSEGLTPEQHRRIALIMRPEAGSEFIVKQLSAAIAANPRLASRLALWGRRLVGDTLLIARASLTLHVTSAADEIRLEPVFTELIAAHTRRMDALGLTA